MSRVSVLVPAYNAEHVLDGALASIAGQSLPPAEVLVLDDGSDDRTGDIAARWTDVLPLRVLRHELNRGLGPTRSALLGGATSQLCALLDADDYWLPEHLEMMVRTWEASGGIVTADAHLWTAGGGLDPGTYRSMLPVPTPDRQLRGLLRRNFVFVGTLFDRSAALAAGGFRDGFLGAEDWDLWIRLVRGGVAVTPVSPPTVVYRLSPGGLTAAGVVSRSAERVLTAAAAEAASPGERRWALRSLAGLRARRHVRSAARSVRQARVVEASAHGVEAAAEGVRWCYHLR